jgi:hypothetical protein
MGLFPLFLSSLVYDVDINNSYAQIDWCHYRRRRLPRVYLALGEEGKTLGEAFPECNTRGRGSGDASHGKDVFPEC